MFATYLAETHFGPYRKLELAEISNRNNISVENCPDRIGFPAILMHMHGDSLRHTASTRSIVRLNGVCFQTGLSKSTIYDQIKKGTFPKPIRLGARAVGWLQGDIHAWIEGCAAKA